MQNLFFVSCKVSPYIKILHENGCLYRALSMILCKVLPYMNIYHLEMAAYIEMHNFFYVSCHLTYNSRYIIRQCKVSPHIEILHTNYSL